MTEKNCLFCNIYNGKEPATVVYKDEEVIVFNDIRPASKNHLLVVPKEHIANAKHLTKEQIPVVENLMEHGEKIIKERNADLADTRFGFHWPPFNSISHLHLHVISPASAMSLIGKIIFKEGTLWFVSPQYVLQRLAKL
ncbi:hypothetical protein RUM43_001830 [Polyplax serrata]|uniref:Adenosine 5'-monophosphoramidase HINT3 n=1 Tax=Polyplax serrata TaxID=468196 RepID=A0AAN8SEF8_POLSC